MALVGCTALYEQPFNSKLDLSFELIRTDFSVSLGPNPFFLRLGWFCLDKAIRLGFDKSQV